MFKENFTYLDPIKEEKEIDKKSAGFLKAEKAGDADNPKEVLDIYSKIALDLKTWRENFDEYEIQNIKEVDGVKVRINNSLNDIIAHSIDKNNKPEILINEDRLLFIIQCYLGGKRIGQEEQNRVLALIIGHELAKVKAKQINPDLTLDDYYTIGFIAEQEIVSDFEDCDYGKDEEFLYDKYEDYINWMHKAERTDFIDLISRFNPKDPIKYLKEQLVIDPETSLPNGFDLEDYGKNAVYWAYHRYESFAMEYMDILGIKDREEQKLIFKALQKEYNERTAEEATAIDNLSIREMPGPTIREMDTLGKEWIRKKFSPEQLEELQGQLVEGLNLAQSHGQFIRKDVMQPPYEMMRLERELKEAPIIHGIAGGASSIDVANEGLVYGWPLPYGMVGTQGDPFSLYRYKWSGYNFGYAVDSVEESQKTGDEYSLGERYQIFMKINGIEVYQRLDKEKQVIFWGKDLETEKILPLRYYKDKEIDAIQASEKYSKNVKNSISSEGYYVAMHDGNALNLGKDIKAVYNWLDENYDRLIDLKKVFKNHEPWPEANDKINHTEKDRRSSSDNETGLIDKDELEKRLSEFEKELLEK